MGTVRRRGDESRRRVACAACGRHTVVAGSIRARLLVVESDDAVRDGIRAILVRAGHETEVAADPETALARQRTAPADVVIINIKGAGLDLVRQVRNLSAEVAVIALSIRTSYGVSDPLAVARQFGADAAMRIPFAPSDLVAAVDEVKP